MHTSFDKLLAKIMRIKILKECNLDLKDVKNYYISFFNLPKNFDFTREKKKFEAILKEMTIETEKSARTAEFIKKFEVQINDN